MSSLPRQSVHFRVRPSLHPPPCSKHLKLLCLPRWYSNDQEDGEGREANEDPESSETDHEGEEEDGEDGVEESESLELLPLTRHHALATLAVPNDFPDVPLLPISRSPIFPRLARMLEASHYY